MATKAEVLTTAGTSIGNVLRSMGNIFKTTSARVGRGLASWYRKGQFGSDGRDRSRHLGARC